MADDRILPMMSKALGKNFIKSKRLPVPVSLTREAALPFAIQKALSATYMTINTGSCIAVKAGHTGMEPRKLEENVIAISKMAVSKFPRAWANVQAISIKTADSLSLPVYTKTPEALREIAKLAGVNADVGVSENKDGERKINKNDKQKTMSEESKKQKRTKDFKSPLLQALKKQKLAEEMGAEKEKRTSQEEFEKSHETKSKRSSSAPPTPRSKKSKNDKDKNAEKLIEEERKQKDFVAAKKFRGSKKGYVFRMGSKGLGYYIDKKPVVNEMAMEAIMRLGQNQGRRKKSRKKGR